MDRYTRDELLAFQDEFDDDSRAAGEPPRVAAAGVPHENADGGLMPSGDPPTTREATRLPEQGENERASATAALKRPGEVSATPLASSGRHDFKASPNPRNDGCAACGRAATNPIHEPRELRDGAAIAALNRAIKSIGEGNTHYAQSEIGFALRVLRGET